MTLLEHTQIDAMSAGNPEMLLPIVSDFRASGRDSLQKLDAVLAGQRFAEAKDLLHQLKGAAGTMGLIQFQQVCGECEAHVVAQTLPPRLPELGPLLEQSVDAACRYLQAG